MKDEGIRNGIDALIAVVIFVLAMLQFSIMGYRGFDIMKVARNEVDDRQLVTEGEFYLSEHILDSSEAIFTIEQCHEQGYEVYINGTHITANQINNAKKVPSRYNSTPFNIVVTSSYEMEYMYSADHSQIVGVSLKTH